MMPIYVVAPAWTVLFILIRDMDKYSQVRHVEDFEPQVDSVDEARENKTESGFEE